MCQIDIVIENAVDVFCCVSFDREKRNVNWKAQKSIQLTHNARGPQKIITRSRIVYTAFIANEPIYLIGSGKGQYKAWAIKV